MRSSNGIRQVDVRGFTLVELLITIVIAGILATQAIPFFQNFVAGQRIKTAAFDVVSMLTLMRSEALKRNTNVTAAPSGGSWQNGWVVTVGSNTINTQPSLKGIGVVCKSSGAVVSCPASITFNGSGRVNSAFVIPSFELSGNGNSNLRCISLDLTGRPTSKTGACS